MQIYFNLTNVHYTFKIGKQQINIQSQIASLPCENWHVSKHLSANKETIYTFGSAIIHTEYTSRRVPLKGLGHLI